MSVTVQVTFDAADPPALAAFWGETLGYKEEDPPEGFDSWEAWAAGGAPPSRSAAAGSGPRSSGPSPPAPPG